ncbi:RNA degradosome polyphosphate kinase [Wukongibacter baidiensis]|uniref:RNA degradosome polyphosphate kinase n=1 Tax=Wukongibacter baidiensis TaxID=1723361 RepID=UPI003D7F8920
MNNDFAKCYINRELSWLEFNNRVLEEAQDKDNPLLERLKFISIVSSNMDEFFMVRVASLWDQVWADFTKADPSGLTPSQQIKKISQRVHNIVYNQSNCYNRSLLVGLKKQNIFFLKSKELNDYQREFIDNYFWKNIYPVLTPMVVDPTRPFPLVMNKSLNIALIIRDNESPEENFFATVQVPAVLGRFIELPEKEGKKYFILLEEAIKMFISTLFNGYEIISMGCYRITRNADLGVDEEGAEDLLETIEQSLRKRKWGNVVRLEVEKGLSKKLLKILIEEMEVPGEGVYQISGPLDLTFLMKFASIEGYSDLKYEPHNPKPAPIFSDYEDIFEAIKENDIILHHPFHSFDPVVELVQKAAKDPNVLAIKQTLYRVSGDSPIIKALAEAAENGKQVTVLLEIKARFDEKNNIIWAKHLEKSGCHVIYGLVGLKTHCKLLLIVRREEDGIKRYVHMGTGNYNDVTAKFYTDIGLFTSKPFFGSDISALFNTLSGFSKYAGFYKIDIAPGLDSKFIDLIEQEANNARKGKEARIIAKMNSLVDEKIIKALYEASCAGVQIDLIVRGICCLRAGVPGVSENIKVRSIVGRFLEHSRIFYFYNDGNEQIYLSSADWMPRNLRRRVELLFPVEDKHNRLLIKEILDISLKDTVKARSLRRDGSYSRIDKRGKEIINSQEYFSKQAKDESRIINKREVVNDFIPITNEF